LLAVPIAWGLWLAVGTQARRHLAVALFAGSLGAVAVAGAWVTRNAVVFGEPRLAAIAGGTFLGAHNERVLADPTLCGSWVSTRAWTGDLRLPRDEAVYHARGWAIGLDFVRRHRRSLPRLELCKLERLLALRLATPNRLQAMAFAGAWLLVGPLALIGLVSGWRRDRVGTLTAALPLFALLATTLLFYGAIRFRHSSEPILVLFAAQGVAALAALRRSRTIVRQRPGAAGAAAGTGLRA
jgi:hypothetical protein